MVPKAKSPVTSRVEPQGLGFTAKLVIGLAVLLFVWGVLWHGISFAVLLRAWRNILERPYGPMSFRFALQPSMAIFFSIHDGLKDARNGRSPFFWTILRKPQERIGRLRDGLNRIARIMLLTLGMDVVYQMIVLDTFHPAEALVVALLLAFVPYVMMRGLAARVGHWWLATRL
jgi:hypothetical protein